MTVYVTLDFVATHSSGIRYSVKSQGLVLPTDANLTDNSLQFQLATQNQKRNYLARHHHESP